MAERVYDEIGFLKYCGLDPDELKACSIEESILEEIFNGFESTRNEYSSQAEVIASIAQKMDRVHSVKWRVKDSRSLVRKIVRKKIEKSTKYNTIDVHNFKSIVTDLIGIRLLHLFKGDFRAIHSQIERQWNIYREDCKVYIRRGDSTDDGMSYDELGIAVEPHPAGYRSIHYVIDPIDINIKAEIQVRTIFEEGWSEIDHKFRYPNYPNLFLINEYLSLFNRFSGMADEMGTYIDLLASNIDTMSDKAKRSEDEAATRTQAVQDIISEKIDELSDVADSNLTKEKISNIKNLQQQQYQEYEESIRASNSIFKEFLAIELERYGQINASINRVLNQNKDKNFDPNKDVLKKLELEREFRYLLSKKPDE